MSWMFYRKLLLVLFGVAARAVIRRDLGAMLVVVLAHLYAEDECFFWKDHLKQANCQIVRIQGLGPAFLIR